MVMDHPVVVKQITKYYGTVKALDSVSLRVGRGELFALLGPNGAGKTTLVEILECLRMPTSGDAYVLGISIRDASGRDEIRKRIGVMLQEADSFEHLTVRETLQFYRRLYGSRRSVEELIDSLDLREHANRPYGKLSGGIKRRVLLAAALVNDPELVFLDEPTTGLDPRSRREVWSLLKGMRREGVTFFMTTHYMEEAEVLADRVAIITRGMVVAEGSPAELIDRYGGSRVLTVSGVDRGQIGSLSNSLRGAKPTGEGISITIKDPKELNEALSLILTLAPRAVLRLRSPTLEDVFLSLTGYRITEEGELA